jgi:hypothetical protein
MSLIKQTFSLRGKESVLVPVDQLLVHLGNLETVEPAHVLPVKHGVHMPRKGRAAHVHGDQ